MKKIYITLLMLITFGLWGTNAQELQIEGGTSFTSFEFKDSQSNELKNLQNTTQIFMSLGYRGNLFKEKINYLAGVGLHSYGAIGSDNALNNYYEWKTTYLNIYLGLDFPIFKMNDFSFRINGTVASEFLIQGTQTLNNQVFNIVGAEDFDSPMFTLRGGASFEYSISETFGVYLKYQYGSSSPFKSSDSGASLSYTSNEVGLGLNINIFSKKTEEETEQQKIEN